LRGPHLWHIAWVRDLIGIAIIILIFMTAYAARAIVVPILIGLALAYVFNPLITYLHTRHRWPRPISAAALIAVAFGSLLMAALIATPRIIAQSVLLFEKLSDYAKVLIAKMEPQVAQRFADAPQQLAELDFATVSDFLVRSLNIGVGVVGSAISFLTYLTIALIVILFCFFFFTWKFQGIRDWFATFIPTAHRTQTLHILGRMDRSISAFIRGRLVQSLIMTILLSAGWYMVGLRYWLLLGVITGLLNLIPFAGVIGFVAAITLAVVDHLAGGNAFHWWILIGPALVYLIAQGLDGWVVEPMVQGKATDLDPLTILLVVLIGGTLAGLLGLLLAIPIAACVKILSQEIILPRLRQKLA